MDPGPSITPYLLLRIVITSILLIILVIGPIWLIITHLIWIPGPLNRGGSTRGGYRLQNVLMSPKLQ